MLSGRLVTVRLSDRPVYRALSYMWGDEANCQHIWLDGQKLSIRENLWRFLRRLRQDGEAGYFWADAICVNQRDVHERSSQVRMMNRIYSEAQQVFVWLGDDMHGDELSNCEQSMLLTGRTTPAFDLALVFPIWRIIVEMASQQYWTRLWIVQVRAPKPQRPSYVLWALSLAQQYGLGFCNGYTEIDRETLARSAVLFEPPVSSFGS
jgi:hypothetical protein